MNKGFLGIVLMLFALLACLAEGFGWLLPSLSWPFTVSREMPLLQLGEFLWFGWLCMLALFVLGWILFAKRCETISPEMRQKWTRFRRIKRGYYSFLILAFLVLLAGLDQVVVGKRALVVSHEGELYFPAFNRAVMTGSCFGLEGDHALAEADYRLLAKLAGQSGAPDWVLMPPVPFASSMDSCEFPREQLVLKNGLVYTPDGESLFDGQASRLYPNGQAHLRLRYRKGVPDGQAQGWAPDRQELYAASYRAGELVSERYSGEGDLAVFLAQSSAQSLFLIHYHPAPPLTGGHLLGTNSQGVDIAAYLFGGLQVNIKAALFYLPIIYFIGVSMGMLMGYFAGGFDIITQRAIEIISQLPFLFVVMIAADFVPSPLRGMLLILVLLALFGWMQMTYAIRTATMKEKARDYVAAARVMGAGTARIIFYHILPNLTAVIITLIPFSVAAVVLSLTSLDYLGFGLPDSYPSWGRLLNDGLSKLSSPWLVSAACGALVVTLLLVSFIGEAIREAFDPRKHSYYE